MYSLRTLQVHATLQIKRLRKNKKGIHLHRAKARSHTKFSSSCIAVSASIKSRGICLYLDSEKNAKKKVRRIIVAESWNGTTRPLKYIFVSLHVRFLALSVFVYPRPLHPHPHPLPLPLSSFHNSRRRLAGITPRIHTSFRRARVRHHRLSKRCRRCHCSATNIGMCKARASYIAI